ncbi:hypothetical protein [Chryseobacterium gambrini]|uniref:hypothetical protein n=1 Tax=Chryseobacterium gambrini TaxID=373672 RepID=UPI003BA60B6F
MQPYIFYIMNTENSILKTSYFKTKFLQKDLTFICTHISVFTFLFFITISDPQKKMFATVGDYVFFSNISFNKYLVKKSNKKREAKPDEFASSLPDHSFITNLVVKSGLTINYGIKVKEYKNIYYHSINYKSINYLFQKKVKPIFMYERITIITGHLFPEHLHHFLKFDYIYRTYIPF